MNKAYKFRIYLDNSQKIQFEKNFGTVRCLFNKLLYEIISEYENNKFTEINCSKLNKGYLQSKIAFLKETEEYDWLKEIHSQIRQNASNQLIISFDRFFKKISGFPVFKKKKENNSFTVPQYFEVNEKTSKIKIPKMKGEIKVKFSKKIKGKICSLTFSKNKTGKYFVSILTEEEISPLNKKDNFVGIDSNVKAGNTFCLSKSIKINFGTYSIYSNKIQLPKTKKDEYKKLIFLNRQLAKKKLGSRRFKEVSFKISKIYEKITSRKTDFLHKISNQITNEFGIIGVENLKIKNMVKNHNLARAISDCNWGQFFQFLDYKSKIKGRYFVKVNPRNTSKTCNFCGSVNKDLKFEENWICPSCKKEIDRDVNASLNIESLALESMLDLKQKTAKPLTKVKALKRIENSEKKSKLC